MKFRRSLAVIMLLFLWLSSACAPAAVPTTLPTTAAPAVLLTPSLPTAAPSSLPSFPPAASQLTLTPSAALPIPSATPPPKTLPVAAATRDTLIHTARDITYAKIAGVDPRLLSLDVYFTDPVSAKRPVLLFIHGGAWTGGDKDHVGFKPEFFTRAGYVFISANYRLSPQAIFPAHVQDVAKAIAWTVKQIRQFGGDPDRLFLMGHSAGGQLVTLVASDEQYLKSFGLGLSALKGVVSLDTAAYDLADFASRTRNHLLPELYSVAFGQDPAVWKLASPATYILPGKHIPPIAVIYSGDVGVGSNVSRQLLSENFEQRLVGAKVPNVLFGALDKNHATINDDFGKPGDKIADQTLAFLNKIASASP